MKYIPAEKLIAEIRIIQQSLEHRDVRFNQVKKIRTECMIEFCKCIFDVIDSLQQEQPEVDLEKYISEKLFNLGAELIKHKPYSFNRGLNVGATNAYSDILSILKARKEE